MNQAHSVLDLTGTPTWALALYTILGIATAGYAFVRLTPLHRTRTYALNALLALSPFIVGAIVLPDRRSLFVELGSFTLAIAMPTLWMGKLPDDMPGASNPAIRNHPEYPRYRRRGAITFAAMMVTIVGAFWLEAVYVRV